ncbi:MAG TPA: Mur ligase domain-containing protein, partial [Candidatus Saccharimonadales bacterium]|nr:Mur ligase domain-containing protein [Candidatus Saccharimonadales bacterium]
MSEPGRAADTVAGVAALAGAALEAVGVRPAAAGRRGVRGAGLDSRTLEKGQVFVALPGERVDGHEFAAQAVRRGAPAVLVRAEWFRERGAALPR